ncbi:MAG: small basic family protein [Fimbriimonadales bacterium]|jgi:small basic protein|nr:small basic family protein [Fimbriimonadales bacterium]
MILIPILALIIGGLIAFFASGAGAVVPREFVGVAALAGIDTVFGGMRAALEGRFRNDLFVTGFFLNIVLAVALVALGFAIGVGELYLAAVITFGSRLFLNLSLIRRHYIARLADAKERNRMEANS